MKKRKMIRTVEARLQKREKKQLDLLRHKKDKQGLTQLEMADLFDLSMKYPDYKRHKILAKKSKKWIENKISA